MKNIVRNLKEEQRVRITDLTTGSTRSLAVLEKIGKNAVLLIRDSGTFMYRRRIRVDDSWKQVWPDLSVKLYQRPRGDWRFVFHAPDNLELDRI